MEKLAVLLLERSAEVIGVARESLGGEVDLHVTNSIDLAVRVVGRLKPLVAILDATMCGAAPAETVAKLRVMHPALRIVFIAEAGVLIDRRHAQLGTLLRKPFTPERFAEVVQSALRLQSMSAGVQRMRHSSGTYAAVQPSESGPPRAPSTFPPAVPPANASAPPRMRNLTPPPPIPRDEAPSPPRMRNLTPPPIPRDEAPQRIRGLTPRPFALEQPTSRSAPPIPREEPRHRNVTPSPIPREEPAGARNRTPRSVPPPRNETPRSVPPPPRDVDDAPSDPPPPLNRPR